MWGSFEITMGNSQRRFSRIKAIIDRRQPDLTVMMDNVHKTHNLAAILRTCDAVGVPTIHAVTYHDQMGVRRAAASGSEKWVDLVIHRRLEDAYGVLRSQNMKILIAHPSGSGRDYRSVDLTRPTAIVVGAELDGLSENAIALADDSISVPTHGMVDSLNVSVASAVILYEALRQREAAGMYKSCRVDQETRKRLLFEYTYPAAGARCKKEGLPYPRLDEDGGIIPASDQSLDHS